LPIVGSDDLSNHWNFEDLTENCFCWCFFQGLYWTQLVVDEPFVLILIDDIDPDKGILIMYSIVSIKQIKICSAVIVLLILPTNLPPTWITIPA
jgi:hypothetical protein